MANDRISARKNIEKLINFFDENIYQFKSSSFNETQARQQLIDPFFEALGWDVHNRLMQPLFRQEVVPESRMKSSTAREVKEQEPLFPKKDTLGKEYKEYASILDYIAEDEYKANSKEAVKKPDYRFRISGQTKFFVEAKKPYVDLVKSQSAIFQVKRYGFSGRVPLAILTDFEEFRTFDCTQRPAFEKPKLGIIKDFDLTYKHYLDQFDHLYDTFSRDAVASGSLETLTKKMMLKRTGDFALDREFLEDLSKWREELARDIAKHPKNRRLLNDYTLNEAVQRILDRIVFIRVCEDREIEVENTLLAILRMWKERPGLSLYSLLNDLFKQRRALYNGLLFSSHQCEELEIGNEVLIKILENLNYPFSPYHFNEIGVEILGSIYEKFLGKTIHLAPKNVVIKEKPEVRKAGGVYYTPQYIVKYIVDNTLGKLLYEEAEKPSEGISDYLQKPSEGNKKLKLSPKQVSKLKIIDIACGSGSFLLGAFQKLIDYHIEWYTTRPEDIKTENNVPDAYKDTDGNYHLSPRKKRDILVNNIYGVDIDRQAVEVTQMSLYLKVLEGENAETLNPQMTLALKEVYLPSLAKNIKCGNSLIGTDFTSQGEMFDEEAQRKVNPFDWEMEFPEILGSMQTPTLSPPYKGGDVRRTEGVEGSRGFDVVIGNPPYRMIQPHNTEQIVIDYMRSHYVAAEFKVDLFHLFLQKALNVTKKSGSLSYIIPATILNNVYVEELRKYLQKECLIKLIAVAKEKVFEDADVHTCIIVFQKDSRTSLHKNNRIWTTSELNAEYASSMPKYDSSFQSDFEELNGNVWNILVNESNASLVKKLTKEHKQLSDVTSINRGLITGDRDKYFSNKKKNNKYVPIIAGTDVERYYVNDPTEYVLFERPDSAGGCWDKDVHFADHKIVVRQIGIRPTASILRKPIAVTGNIFTVMAKDEVLELFILGIINSKITSFYWQIMFNDFKSSFPQVTIFSLSQLPIRTIDFNNPVEKKMHDDLVSLVEKMLELNKQLQKAHFDSEKEPIERQIAATDKKIDDIVYALYGLTAEEIKIVEGKSS
jgi:type I restriction-modification system DNA methylase subunit